MLSVKNLVKIYRPKKAEPVKALDGVTIDFADTGLVFLLGKSGSGKSTLLNAIGGLDTFDEGEIIIKGKSSKEFSQSDFDSYRNTFIGFIFQEYNILENFTVEKNLALAIELQGKKPNKEEINKLLEQVDMIQYAKRKPNQLSGGQKQRVAIARALIKHPEIIMADEPTGALDSNTGKQVMETLKKLSKEKLVIVVSHDREFAEFYGDRIIELKDGKIISDVTKKEVQAQETASGIKLIDNSIVYIKKGQEISDTELKKIAQIINENSKKADTFISFDPKANAELKRGASINDDGNREKFEKTLEEDVKLKKYNGKSLKLIKSRLKFTDSLKMGASSLKNKVGKLIFTILLSFLAFTVFGVVDALSCWNRADSVYEAMQITNTTNIVMRKTVDKGMYTSDMATLKADLEDLQERFPDHTIKGVVSQGWGGVSIELENGSVESTQNPLWQTNISGYVHMTAAEIENLGFTVYGDLPTADNEICISKHMFDSLVKGTANKEDSVKITEGRLSTVSRSNPINIRLGGFLEDYWGIVKVIGIVDDKTNLDKYKDMEDEEIMQDYTISQVLQYSYTRLAYTNQAQYEKKSNGVSESIYYAMDFGQGSNSWSNWYLNSFYTIEEKLAEYDNNVDSLISNYSISLKDGVDITNLAKDEIIINKWDISNYFTDPMEKINEGLTLKLKYDIDDENALTELKIVGYSENGWSFASEECYEETLKPLYQGYEFIVSGLIGDEAADKALVNVCENFDENGIKFTIQNSTTPILNMLEEILMMMTSVFVWVAVGFAVFASLLLMNFISTSINYKKREIGVLRALGARGSDIFGIFFNESTIIALINFALASIATIAACTIINSALIAKLGMEIALLNVGIRQVALILAVSWGAAFLASLIPSLKISKKKPIDAINNR